MPTKPPQEVRLSDGNVYVPVRVLIHKGSDGQLHDVTIVPHDHESAGDEEVVNAYLPKDVVHP